ncbi:Guanine nucleotide-binding protein G(t) subunit alpha-2 [Lobulomyces angularis]|nr:Guanine nucleotide-binding protein G(t) subunit alpha-2 [Lobulomyces angularis]
MKENKKEKKLKQLISNEIDAQIKKEKAERRKISKLILLGSGDCGKSTVLKQMKILHKDGFSTEERNKFLLIIYNNIIDAIITLAKAAKELNVDIETKNHEFLKEVLNFTKEPEESMCISKELSTKISQLWQDPGIKLCWERGNEFNIQDNSNYFLDRVNEICSPNFLPDNEYILRSRLQTLKITETTFNILDAEYVVYDVGGQKSQRVFWAPYLSGDLQSIIFVSSVAAFDQTLIEDNSVNRMEDSLKLLETICANELLKTVPIILFLNKMDLLEIKLKSSKSKLDQFFTDFHEIVGKPNASSRDMKTVKLYFKKKFHKKCLKHDTYTHFTTSTDTKLMKAVILAVNDIVLRANLTSYGIKSTD